VARSLNCFRNALLCWQLISVQATNRVAYFLFSLQEENAHHYPPSGYLNFLPKPQATVDIAAGNPPWIRRC